MSVTLRAMNSKWLAIGVAAALVLWGGAARAELRVDAALRKAAEQGDTVTVESLLAQGADADRSDALLAAILAGQRRSIDLLLDRGADLKPGREDVFACRAARKAALCSRRQSRVIGSLSRT